MKTDNTDDFDYNLPTHLIAQEPLELRTSSKMMSVSKESGVIEHLMFTDFVHQLSKDDCLIFNDTRVFPARLLGCKSTGGKVECLIERLLGEQRVLAHIKSSKSPKPGAELTFEGLISATVLGRQGELFEIQFNIEGALLDALNADGRLPLPPYITRPPSKADYRRYQTVFAEKVGAIAAPTAGLHFDDAILELIRRKGIPTAAVTLHVGAGTFQPVRVDNLQDHKMHSEWVNVDQRVCDVVASCQRRGGRVIAVGTTVLRALESASLSGSLIPYTGETDIFIYPGFKFRCVDAMLTNFHLPKSTLLMLVSALASREIMLSAYQTAVEHEYRFFSYGDCMLIST